MPAPSFAEDQPLLYCPGQGEPLRDARSDALAIKAIRVWLSKVRTALLCCVLLAAIHRLQLR